jgi:hypothetical protein
LIEQEEVEPIDDTAAGGGASEAEQAQSGADSSEGVLAGDVLVGSQRYIVSYRIVDIALAYPETGRRLGIWRQWVARDLELTVAINVQESATGRLLLSDRVNRSFGDRVPSDDFNAVDSDLYPFTTADPGESGWKSRFEEIVVLGALAALVAVYLANTQ